MSLKYVPITALMLAVSVWIHVSAESISSGRELIGLSNGVQVAGDRPPLADSDGYLAEPSRDALGSIPADTLARFDFPTNSLEGWHVQELGQMEYWIAVPPDKCEFGEGHKESIPVPTETGWSSFEGVGAFSCRIVMDGYDNGYCDWKTSTESIERSGDWNGANRIVARVYNHSDHSISMEIVPNSTWIGSNWQGVSPNQWSEVYVNENAVGEFSNLTRLRIALCAHKFRYEGTVYVDWVAILKVDYPGTPELLSPVDGSSSTDRLPVFDWTEVPEATRYRFQHSQDPSFGSGVTSLSLETTGYQMTSPLANGQYFWRVRAINAEGFAGSYSEPYSFTIVQENRDPVLSAIGDRSVQENSQLQFTVFAEDPDSDALILTALPVPVGAEFTDNSDGTGQFTWTPNFNQAGTHQVTFTASDGSLADDETITITIGNKNRDPVLANIDNQVGREGELLEFTVSAVDPDNDAITLTTSPRPTGAEFTDNGDCTGLFSWTPAFGQVGTFHVTFTASDSDLDDSQQIVIEIGSGPVLVTPTTPLDFERELVDILFYIKNSGETDLHWSVDAGYPAWVTVTPMSGVTGESDSSAVTVSIDRGHGAVWIAGEYDGSIRLNSNGGSHDLNVSMYTSLRAEMEERVGIQITDSIRIPFNSMLDTETLLDALDMDSTGSYQGYSLSLEIGNHDDVPHTVLYISADDESEFAELAQITVDLSGLAEQGTDPESFVGTFVSGAGVWPGDTGHDGVVDERDILPIGLYYHASGPGRESIDNNWDRHLVVVYDSGQMWEPLKAVYADADGSGVVEAMDICAIADNWRQTSSDNSSMALATGEGTSVLKQLETSTLSELRAALVDCDESTGRSILLEQLEQLLTEPGEVLPVEYALHQNYPNPFNPVTQIEYSLPEPGHVRLRVYNVIGQLVTTLVDDHRKDGHHRVEWHAVDDRGNSVSSGIYLYRLECNETSLTRTMVLLR